MPAIDKASFDGTVVQTELQADCGFTPDRTQIGLVAQAIDGFLVVQGSDAGMAEFSDNDISAIFVTFADTVAQYPNATAATMRTAVLAALSGMWTPFSGVTPCPFDEVVTEPARLIFHVAIPGWGFEAARIKFKSEFPEGEFCGLDWLMLNGANCAPYSFKLNAKCSAQAQYEFALFIRASQDAGVQSTRVIIDPMIDVIPSVNN